MEIKERGGHLCILAPALLHGMRKGLSIASRYNGTWVLVSEAVVSNAGASENVIEILRHMTVNADTCT